MKNLASKIFKLFVFAGLCLGLAPMASAAKISVQGVLRDSHGDLFDYDPVAAGQTAPTAIFRKIADPTAPSTGTAYCAPVTLTGFKIQNGAFSVSLTPCPAVLTAMSSDADDWYIEIEGSFITSQSLPSTYRFPLNQVPFALYATSLAANTVTSSHLVDGTVATADLANGAVTAAKLGALSVDTANLIDDAVSTAKIANSAVTNAKITSMAFSKLTGTAGIADANKYLQWDGAAWAMATVGGTGTVTNIATGTGLSGGPITTTGTISIANLGVDTAQLAASAVATAKIADGAVTNVKITGPIDWSKISMTGSKFSDLADYSTYFDGSDVLKTAKTPIATATARGTLRTSITGYNGTTVSREYLTLDGTGNIVNLNADSADTATVATNANGIRGTDVSTTAPTLMGQTFRYNSGTSKWEPSAAPTTADADAQVTLSPAAVGKKALVVQAKALQTANIQEWQDSTGTPVTYIDKDGKIHGDGSNLSGLSSVDWTAPGTIGSVTPNTGAFTTLAAGTSVRSPLVVGGTADSASLTLKSTSHVTPSGSYLLLNPGSEGNVGVGTSTPRAPLHIARTSASADYGALSIGTGPFDGSTAGYFGTGGSSSASGTQLAVNAAAAYAGDLANLQLAGVSKFKVSSAGAVTATSFTGDGSGLANVAAASIAAGSVTGTLGVDHGGTGAITLTSKGILYGNTTAAVGVTAAGAQYQCLQAGAGGTPAFDAVHLDQSAAITGTLLVDNGGTGLASYTAGDLIYASAGTTLSKLAKGTANQVLGMNNGATAPEYKTVTGTASQITVTHGANSITLATPQDIATTSSPTFAGLTAATLASPAATVLALTGTTGMTLTATTGSISQTATAGGVTLTGGAGDVTFTPTGSNKNVIATRSIASQNTTAIAAIAGGATIDFSLGNVQYFTYDGATNAATFTLSNMISGGSYTVILADSSANATDNTFTFTCPNAGTSYYSPNTGTSTTPPTATNQGRTVYTMLYFKAGSGGDTTAKCFISQVTGF